MKSLLQSIKILSLVAGILLLFISSSSKGKDNSFERSTKDYRRSLELLAQFDETFQSGDIASALRYGREYLRLLEKGRDVNYPRRGDKDYPYEISGRVQYQVGLLYWLKGNRKRSIELANIAFRTPAFTSKHRPKPYIDCRFLESISMTFNVKPCNYTITRQESFSSGLTRIEMSGKRKVIPKKGAWDYVITVHNASVLPAWVLEITVQIFANGKRWEQPAPYTKIIHAEQGKPEKYRNWLKYSEEFVGGKASITMRGKNVYGHSVYGGFEFILAKR